MGIGHFHPNSDGKKYGANGDPLVRVGHLCFIQSLALGGGRLGVVPHPYHAQQFGTGNRPRRGSSNDEPGHLFVVGDKWHTGDNVG